MTAKQNPLSLQSPDGSYYVTLTDGAGTLAPATGGGPLNPNGQATMANSAPVVIASNQSAVPVTLTSTTITGTVAATQSGTWTVQPGNTANTTAWKVDGSAVTQPVSAASLPLPTGAATSAAQTTMATNQTNGTQQTKLTDGTNVMAVKAASTAPLTTDPAAVFTLSPNSPGLVILGQTTKAASVPVTLASDQGSIGALSSDYPSGATPVVATSGNVAAAVASATLSGTSGKTTYITGFQITGSGATIGVVVDVTVTNLIGSITYHYEYAAIAGALLMNTPLIVNFSKPIPASAQNTSIVVSCPSLGTGNTNNSVNAMGYQL